MRTKIKFETVNKGKYTVIPKKDIAETNARIKKEMKAKKTFTVPRCKYMPTPDNTVIIFSTKRGKIFEAGFTIGNQDFTMAEKGTQEEATFFCDMLEIAFTNLITPKSLENVKSETAKKMFMDNMLPKITITNLK